MSSYSSTTIKKAIQTKLQSIKDTFQTFNTFGFCFHCTACRQEVQKIIESIHRRIGIIVLIQEFDFNSKINP